MSYIYELIAKGSPAYRDLKKKLDRLGSKWGEEKKVLQQAIDDLKAQITTQEDLKAAYRQLLSEREGPEKLLGQALDSIVELERENESLKAEIRALRQKMADSEP